ncbi:hypothetical protein RFI_32040 [Reticulomyxa filosa]|uniref:Uncharacterized protein n=1 Tax=Reticulomyxa filosa TaxID=46433 RepID=X6LVG9_RETFI|nr:hypothetical protein RFI_32040 [Reticulomyxa filosa]|eukprot:ETO05356.1 hypothetical protein RFI_32040 [Reticulomyxa filosa]
MLIHEKNCATSNLNKLNLNKMYIINIKNEIILIYNRLKEENEIKISREMCLLILWNILKYHKYIKYRQIHKQVLHNYLFQKCQILCIYYEKIFIVIERELNSKNGMIIIGIINIIISNYYVL